MHPLRPLACTLTLALAGTGLAGCGSSSSSSTSGSTAATTAAAAATAGATTTAAAPPSSSTSGPGALTAEARSAATGDIPDNQTFLVFVDRPAGFSLKYPEGWAQRGSGGTVAFRNNNNVVRVDVGSGSLPTAAGARAELARLHAAQPTLVVKQIVPLTISGAPAVKTVYTTVSAASPVTGKRVTLVVDRYYLAHGGRRAVVDLGTPVGVDNVDAYRLIIRSFQWR